MMQILSMTQQDNGQELWRLRRFMKQNEVPSELCGRVLRYLDHIGESRKQLVASDMAIIQQLTPTLQEELHYASCMRMLRRHPVFRFVETESNVAMSLIVTSAVKEQELAKGDAAFHQNTLAEHMVVLIKGRANYVLKYSGGRISGSVASWLPCESDNVQQIAIQAGTFMAEPALWLTNFLHCGDLCATTDGSIIRVDAKSFGEAVKMSPPIHFTLARYAEKLLDDAKREETHGWLNDICVVEKADVGIQSAMLSLREAMPPP
jgi:CRP-like cAMP-binding protein